MKKMLMVILMIGSPTYSAADESGCIYADVMFRKDTIIKIGDIYIQCGNTKNAYQWNKVKVVDADTLK